jgi:hypothetical protein
MIADDDLSPPYLNIIVKTGPDLKKKTQYILEIG